MRVQTTTHFERRMALLTLFALVLFGGCEASDPKPSTAARPSASVAKKSDEPNARPSQPEESAKRKATTGDTKVVAKTWRQPELDRSSTKSAMVAVRSALKVGREAVRAKDYAKGIKHFDDALKLDPTNARVLGELGWAAFLLGDLKRARHATERSLAFSHSDVNLRASTLYNLGRIAEEEGHKEEAATHYSASLQLRPHNVVQARLESLNTEPKADDACGWRRLPDAPDRDLCAWYAANHKGDDGQPLECELKERKVQNVGEHSLLWFEVLDRSLSTGFVMLAWRAKSEVWIHHLGDAPHPGVSYMDSGWEVGAAIPNKSGQGVILPITFNSYDGDYSENTVESWTQKWEARLLLGDTRAVWKGAVRVSKAYDYEPMLEGEPSRKSGRDFPVHEVKEATVKWGPKTVVNAGKGGTSSKIGRFVALPERCIAEYSEIY